MRRRLGLELEREREREREVIIEVNTREVQRKAINKVFIAKRKEMNYNYNLIKSGIISLKPSGTYPYLH